MVRCSGTAGCHQRSSGPADYLAEEEHVNVNGEETKDGALRHPMVNWSRLGSGSIDANKLLPVG